MNTKRIFESSFDLEWDPTKLWVAKSFDHQNLFEPLAHFLLIFFLWIYCIYHNFIQLVLKEGCFKDSNINLD